MLTAPSHVIAYFAAGVINDHVLDEVQPEQASCCPTCCAPCAALVWLRDNARDDLDRAVVEHLGAGWEWLADGRIDWERLNGRLGCRQQEPCLSAASERHIP